jgi:hypothetical protein
MTMKTMDAVVSEPPFSEVPDAAVAEVVVGADMVWPLGIVVVFSAGWRG